MEEFYPKDKDIKKLMKYIAGKGKENKEVRYYKGFGVCWDPEKAANQMIKIQKYYKKHQQSRRAYHLIMSFENPEYDVNLVKYAADRIGDMLGKRYQIFYGIHEDTKNLHIHFVVNAVSYADGRKWHKSKKETKELKESMWHIAEEVLGENG